MAQHNQKITEYIANAESFAKPILEHWRELIHRNCPEVVEAIKWSIPHFDYKGDFMCVMASYKNHCSFTFMKSEIMNDQRLKEIRSLKPTQRYLGKITGLSDLPDDQEFVSFLQEAMVLNEKGIKVITEKSDKPKVFETPEYFVEKLAATPAAIEIFEGKSNSFRKEYIVWISDAKTDETRQKRMKEAIGWILEGKSRFWKNKKTRIAK